MSFKVDLDSAVLESDYYKDDTADKPERKSTGFNPEVNTTKESAPFSVDLESAELDEKANQGVIGTLVDGAKSTARAISSTYNTYTGDGQAVVDNAQEQELANDEKSQDIKNFQSDFAANTGAGTDEEVGLWGAIKGTGKAIVDNPRGAALSVVEQFPNSVPTLAAGWAGAKGGAMAGGAVGSAFGGVGAGPGALIGGAVGFVGGMFLGNTLTETGHKAQEYAADGEFTPDEQSAAMTEGAKKAGVITAVDAITFGIGGKVSSTMRRTAENAVEAATRKTLLDAGVDISDTAALTAARSNPQIASQVVEAQKNAAKIADNLRKRAGEAGALLTMETVGEGLGEYLGELAATGQASVADAVLESFLSLGQSGVQSMFNFAKARERSLTDQEWIDASNGIAPEGMAPEQMPVADGIWDKPTPEAKIDMGQMQGGGVTPAPVFDQQDIDSKIGAKPSQQMGINPDAGPLSAAAAQSVDSGLFTGGFTPQAGINQSALEREGVTPPPVLDADQIDRNLGSIDPLTGEYMPAPGQLGQSSQAGGSGNYEYDQWGNLSSVDGRTVEGYGQNQPRLGFNNRAERSTAPLYEVGPDGVARPTSGETARSLKERIDLSTLEGRQQTQAQKQPDAMPEQRTPEQIAQHSWDSMNTFERNAAAANVLGMRGVPAKNAATKAWDKLSSEQQAKLVTGLESQQGKRWIDPNQKVTDQTGPVLQNRDRTSQDSINQMRSISNNPDYSRLKTSGFLSDGAPVVVDENIQIPVSQVGVTDTASAGSERFNVQYAVVEADQLMTSNSIEGTTNAEYQTGAAGKARAIAGNGRITGLQSAWAKGNANQYKADMAVDRMHGIAPSVIEGMRNPILVRLLPQDQVTDNIGDLSNRDEKGRLSPVEQSKTDMGRIDLDSLKFTAEGAIGGEAIHQFRMAQPAAERVSEAEARKRLTSAIFQKAYGNDQLTEIQSGESDDAKSIMSALAQAAPSMSRLEGAGEFDVRPLITQAGIAAVNAARRGTKLSDYVQQSEMGIDPMVYPILEMMLNDNGNIRSSKYIGEQLTNMAKLAYDEANSPSSDMFGEKPKRTAEQVIQDALTGVQGYGQINDGTGQESLGQRGRSEPDAQMVEGPEGERERPADTRQSAPAQQEPARKQPETELTEKPISLESTETSVRVYGDVDTIRQRLRAEGINFSGAEIDGGLSFGKKLESKIKAVFSEDLDQEAMTDMADDTPIEMVQAESVEQAVEPQPEAWRTNYLRSAKVARDLGIDPKQHKKLAELVAAIDAFNAEPVAQQGSQAPDLDLTQQTEETLAADAERLEQLQKEEAAQKAKQKAAESKARERDADKARADEVVNDFQLGQSAEEVMSGMGDIFDDKTNQPIIKFSRNNNQPNNPTTNASLLKNINDSYPALTDSVVTMLQRGRKGQKGGLVIVDSNNGADIAKAYSKATGMPIAQANRLFSNGESINGFYDPKSGITFLVGPNLDATTAPAVLLHEVTHSQQRSEIDARSMKLINGREKEKNANLKAFLETVSQRMIDAGEEGNALESTSYIVEQAIIEGRSQGYTLADSKFFNAIEKTLGATVASIVRDFTKMVRQFALRRGLPINVTLDDLVQYAIASVDQAAKGNIETENKDGMAYSFAGEDALTADIASLDEAKKQIATGLTPEQVRKNTGWMQGAEGRWRFEIDDSNASFVDAPMLDSYLSDTLTGDKKLNAADQKALDLLKLKERNMSAEVFGAKDKKTEAWDLLFYEWHQVKQQIQALDRRASGDFMNVGSLLNHDQLFNAYPGMKNIKIRLAVDDSVTMNGFYDRKDNLIEMTAPNKEKLMDGLLHELQHAIQSTEGFARGGSPSQFDYKDATSEYLGRVSNKIIDLLNSNKEFGAAVRKVKQEFTKLSNKYPLTTKDGQESVNWDNVPTDESEAYFKLLDETEKHPEVERWHDLETEYRIARRDGKTLTPFEQYQSLAGEVEARNVESRRHFTEEERKEFSPIASEDFQRQDQTIRYSKAQTKTPAFKKWFGDSKVVDANGEPLVVYHGTTSTDITQFLPEGGNIESGREILELFRKARKDNKKFGTAMFRSGSYFSPKPEYAGSYTSENTGAIYPVYIKAESPLYINSETGEFDGPTPFRTPDAIIIWSEETGINEIAVIDPTQIKSAVGNNGDFDGTNPDIRYSKSKKDTDPKNLYVAHNLSVDNLLYADQLGGLAAPSLAVGNIDAGAFDSFGEITLLADPSILESSKARTFDADVYTPRHPKAVYDINRKAYDAMADSIKELPGDLRFPDISSLDDSGPSAILYSDAAKLLYLTEQGKAPAAKQKKVGAWLKKAAKLGVNRNELANDARFQKIALDEMKRVTEELYKADPVIAKRRERFFTEVDENGNEFVPFSRLNSMVNEVVRYQDSGGIDSDQLKTDISKKFRTKKSEEDFKQWVTDKFNSMTDKKRIFKGFTPAGSRKYVDYNLDNIVKEMTRQVQGGEGFNYGVGSIRAMYASEMKSVDSVKARRDKIVSADEFNKIKEEANKKFDDVMVSLAPYYKYDADSFSYVSDASQSIAEGPSGWREAFDLDTDSRKIITDFVDYLKNLPTEYFETKVGRAVDLSEFSYAIVPKGTQREAVNLLKEKGIKVKTYDPGVDGSREAAIRNTNDIRFSRSQTKTPAFKKWFGDSKVVDANGEPLVVYHGTQSSEFNTFENQKQFNIFGDKNQFYFTENQSEASGYATGNADTIAKGRSGEGRVIAGFLKIENPADLRSATWNVSDIDVQSYFENMDMEGLYDALVSAGYDGIIYDSELAPIPVLGNHYVVFEPTQIKSATDNNGDFDGTNPDIRYSKSQTKTPEFKRWFGDSILTVDGKPGSRPLRLYHGTSDDISVFDLNHPNRKDTGWLGTGVYLADKPGMANTYANIKAGSAEPNVMPLYARLENPYMATLEDKKRLMEGGRKAADNFAKELRRMGHDGVILEFKDVREIVIFDTAGVKSATGNVGAYGQRQVTADEATRFGMTQDEANEAQGRGDIRFSRAPQTESAAFKKWFGDSKVVGADGKPLVVYHGTQADFSEFSLDFLGDGDGNTDWGDGFYFSSDPDAANNYAVGDGGNVMPVYLSMKNPANSEVMMSPEIQDVLDDGMGFDDLAEVLEGMGYDGIAIEHKGGAIEYVVFNAVQIKSAIGNNGDFDGTNPDIRYSRAYHGSIHQFNKFQLQSIGTGEGAQAFGWGLYFAESRGIAEAYKETFAQDYRDQWIKPANEKAREKLSALTSYADGALTYYAGEINERSTKAQAVKAGRELVERNPNINEYYEKAYTGIADMLESGELVFNPKIGSIYEVEIPDSDVLLDYDAKLSDQPSKVKKAINKLKQELPIDFVRDGETSMRERMDEWTGKEFYDYLTSWSNEKGMPHASSKDAPDKKASMTLNDAGIPGLRYLDGISRKGGDGTRNYVIWDESVVSIESINYQKLEADVLFSRTANPASIGAAPNGMAAWDSPSASKFDDFVYKIQDKHVDTKRVIAAIRDTGKAISDDLDVYLQETLFHGRAAKRTQDFLNKEVNPLIEYMQSAKVEMSDLEEFLHARHAQEANALIAKRDPNMPDGGSGMTNAEASKYLNSLNGVRRKQFENAAKMVDKIIGGTRETIVNYGLESQETVDGWTAGFKHYIPLQREDKDGQMGIGQGFSVKGKETKGRTGSTRKVVDILANVMMQRERIIVRGEKNRVAAALLGLAKDNPLPDFWKVDVVPTSRVIDKATGMVRNQVDPAYKSRDNAVVAKVNGKEHAVLMNEDDPRAMRMAEALKNLDAAQLEGLLGATATATRYFAAVNTQYNPIFGVTNFVRDIQEAMLHLQSTPLAGQQARLFKNTFTAVGAVMKAERDGRKGNNATGKWGVLWEDFQNTGGQTGFRDQFSSSADRGEAIKSALTPDGWADTGLGKLFTAGGVLKVPLEVARKKAAWLFDLLSDYNTAMENGVRLSAYETGINAGMSKEQAAALAKGLTVNFNRKGQVTQQVGALYAFFNASVQGTARLGQSLFDMDAGKPKTLRLSSLGKKIVSGGVMLGASQAVLLAMAGFDDEEPPEFIRERNIIIPTGGKTYISIPMPLGYHVIANLGRIPMEFVLGGGKDGAKHLFNLMDVMADIYNPIGNSGLSMQTIAPTVLDPLAGLAENKDFSGRAIAKESFNRQTPGHALARDTASLPATWLSELINYATGGTEFTRGELSPTPDQIDYLVGQLTGGVGRETTKFMKSIQATATGDDLPWHNIPLAGRFFGDADSDGAKQSAFYNNMDKVRKHAEEVKGLRASGRSSEAAEYTNKYPHARLHIAARAAETQVKGMRDRKRELEQAGAPREEIRALEQRMIRRMEQFTELAESRK